MSRFVRLVVLIAVIASVGVLATDPVAARAPPQAVCGVCTAFAGLTTVGDATVTGTHSQMTIRVYANGSSRWTARVRLASGADALRNDTLRETALSGEYPNPVISDATHVALQRSVADDRVGQRSFVENDTLVVTYLVRNTSHVTLGVVRFDAFGASGPPLFAMGGEGTPYPGADTLVLYAPDDYTVRGHGATGSANDTAVTWRGDAHAQSAGDMGRHTVVSFTKRGSVLPGLRARLAGVVDWF